MARLPRYNLTYAYTESGEISGWSSQPAVEIKILDGDQVVDRFGRGGHPWDHLPLMIWDDDDDTGVRLISSPNDFGLRIYTLEGHESQVRHEFLNMSIAQIGPMTKRSKPKVVVTHAVVLRGVGEVFSQDLGVIRRIEEKIYSLLIGNTLKIPTLSQWGEGEDVWKFEPDGNGNRLIASCNAENQGTKSYWEWQTYIFKKYGALDPNTL